MEVWIDSEPFYSMADSEVETAEYSRTARLVNLASLGFTKQDFDEYSKAMDAFMKWQCKLEEAYELI